MRLVSKAPSAMNALTMTVIVGTTRKTPTKTRNGSRGRPSRMRLAIRTTAYGRCPLRPRETAEGIGAVASTCRHAERQLENLHGQSTTGCQSGDAAIGFQRN